MAKRVRRRLPVLEGVLPIDTAHLGPAIAAGVTLAALGIPEVMGYTKIAGMPVVTGLYTILIPIAVFAVLGSSRHLVVGADSATAAILAAGLAGLAAAGSPDYVSLAGILAIMCAGILLLARLLRLGFLADFLSRSVLIGFLTGVGVQVAMGQVAGMLGVPGGTTGGTIEKFVDTLKQVGDANGTTVVVSVSVLATILILRVVNEKIPGALIAVIGAIWAAEALDLASKGVQELGKVPGGLPTLSWPSQGWNEWATLLGTAVSIFLVILAQSAATSRAYAAKYNEVFHENTDLVGLSLANLSAGVTGTFVVNGSPTKTQMVDSAGGRSQLSQLVTAVIVLVVLLFLTKPLQYMPEAVLASIVFLIGVELVDWRGMRRIWRWRRDEFLVAAATGAVVVIVGVEQGVVLAIVLSILDHLRASYHPRSTYLVRDETGFHSEPVVPGEPPLELVPGLVVYRFGAIMYYANAARLAEDIRSIMTSGDRPPAWLCLDLEIVTDVDFSSGQTQFDAIAMLKDAGTTLVLTRVKSDVRRELERYGLIEAIGEDHVFRRVKDVEDAFAASRQQQS